MNENGIWNITIPSGFNTEPLPKPKILLVDDREENLFALKKLLAKMDAEVITASNGPDALAESLRHEFALVLLDVQMPTMNGFEVAECLRENEESAKVPIIFLTAISKEEKYVFQGYDTGAVDYIFKPIDPSILLAKVRVFLDLARQHMQLRRLTHVLTELNERHARLLESMNEGVLGVDRDGTIVFANPAAQRLLRAPNSVVGKPVLRYLEGQDGDLSKWREHDLFQACLNQRPLRMPDQVMHREDGSSLDVEYHFGPLSPEHGVAGGVLTFDDITARKRVEKALKHQATYDRLTGIPNRALFFDTLKQTLARSERRGSQVALLFIDLDGFKEINDTFGHGVGDLALVAFCERCRGVLRAGDFFARLGGDEFVVLIEDAPDRESLETFAEKLCQAVGEPLQVENHQVKLSASVGVVLAEAKGLVGDALISAADKAMYAAKKAGKNTWQVRQFQEV